MKCLPSLLVLLFPIITVAAADGPGPGPVFANSTANPENMQLERATNNGVTTASVVVKYSLEQVRVALDLFATQSKTNNRYGGFTPLGIHPMTTDQGDRGVRLVVCACGTPAPCYEVQAANLSTNETRLLVRSSYPDQAEYCARRDPRILGDVAAILARQR